MWLLVGRKARVCAKLERCVAAQENFESSWLWLSNKNFKVIQKTCFFVVAITILSPKYSCSFFSCTHHYKRVLPNFGFSWQSKEGVTERPLITGAFLLTTVQVALLRDVAFFFCGRNKCLRHFRWTVWPASTRMSRLACLALFVLPPPFLV